MTWNLARTLPLRCLTLLLFIAAPLSFAADPWSRDDAAHLLRRAGFGGTPAQIDALHALGQSAAVDYLLTGQTPANAQPIFPPATFPDFAPTRIPQDDKADPKERYKTVQRLGRQDLFRYRGHWVDRMIRTDRPLEEKMTLFWHGLLCSGIQEVKLGGLLIDQNKLFHQHALGNYKTLIAAVIRDPAMLKYLDADKNIVGKPNENLAREILELFTMGEGQGYTEKDITELARALTGMGVLGRDGAAAFRPRAHDPRPKTVFGKTGSFKPDDVPGLIFAQPQPPQYLAKKLWEFFANPNPSPEDLAPVAKALRDSRFELKPALRALFTSPAFYGERAKFALIQSPTELCVSTARKLELTPSGILLAAQLGKMGQELFQPPNVKGWPGGEQWITAATLFNRYNTATALVEGKLLATEGAPFFKPNNNKPNAPARGQKLQAAALANDTPAASDTTDKATPAQPRRPLQRFRESMQRRRGNDATRPNPMIPAANPANLFPSLTDPNPAQLIDAAITRFLQRPLHPDKRTALITALGDTPLKLGTPDSDRRTREMLSLLLSTPEYQVH